MTNCELLIGGTFVDTPSDRTTLFAPYDGQAIGKAPEGSWPEMDGAIGAATLAYQTWSVSSNTDRQSLLRRIAANVRKHEPELVDILTREVGKPVTLSRGEVARTALTFELAADLLARPTVDVLPTDFDPRGAAYHCSVERFPVGPVLAVTPYNWPYNLAAHKIAPALAAGNTVVLKPSPLAPLSSLTLARVIHESGCPTGVLNAVTGDGPTTQRALLDDRIKVLSFTGSDSVGWKLKALVPEKKVILELGGDASVIIMPDADLDWAVSRTVAGAFGYAGQICISVQHVRVHCQIYEELRYRLIEATRACPTGDPQTAETVCGPLIHSTAAERVMEWIDEAKNGGGQVRTGGERDGNVVLPTLVEYVSPDSRLGCREVFGPVATLSSFSTVDEAIDEVNGSPFGIQAGVFTQDEETVETFYRRLDIGGVVVNDSPTLRFDNMPYGGVKRSGFGREGVAYAYDEMTEPKVLLKKLL